MVLVKTTSILKIKLLFYSIGLFLGALFSISIVYSTTYIEPPLPINFAPSVPSNCTHSPLNFKVSKNFLLLNELNDQLEKDPIKLNCTDEYWQVIASGIKPQLAIPLKEAEEIFKSKDRICITSIIYSLETAAIYNNLSYISSILPLIKATKLREFALRKIIIGTTKGGHPNILEYIFLNFNAQNYLDAETLKFVERPDPFNPLRPSFWGSDQNYENMISLLKDNIDNHELKIKFLSDDYLEQNKRNYLGDHVYLNISYLENLKFAKENHVDLGELTKDKYSAFQKSMDWKAKSTDIDAKAEVYTQEQLEAFQVGANDKGQLVYINQPNLPLVSDTRIESGQLTDGMIEWMYVVDTKGRIYTTPRDDKHFHSSLAVNKNPVAAGRLHFNLQGKLISADEDSGHFKFYHHIHILEEELGQLGVDSSQMEFIPSEYKRLPLSERYEVRQKIQLENLNNLLNKDKEGYIPIKNRKRPSPYLKKDK